VISWTSTLGGRYRLALDMTPATDWAPGSTNTVPTCWAFSEVVAVQHPPPHDPYNYPGGGCPRAAAARPTLSAARDALPRDRFAPGKLVWICRERRRRRRRHTPSPTPASLLGGGPCCKPRTRHAGGISANVENSIGRSERPGLIALRLRRYDAAGTTTPKGNLKCRVG
jgi:hypothetical protein